MSYLKQYSIAVLLLFFVYFNLFGQCWEIVLEPPSGFEFEGLSFATEDKGWLSGLNAEGDTNIIVKTTNGGENWITTFYPDPTFGDPELDECCRIINFPNVLVGYGAAFFSNFHKTINGGLSWEKLPTENYPVWDNVRAIEFPSLDTGWVSVNQIGLLKTSDGGQTWEEQFYGNGKIFDMAFLDGQRGWCVFTHNASGTGYLYRTIDGGENWELDMQDNNNAFTGIEFLNDSIGWVSGWSDYMYKTTDGGENWEFIDLSSEDLPLYVTALEFVNDSLGWMFSRYGFDYRMSISTDGGENWHKQSLPPPRAIKNMVMIDENTGWAIDDQGNLLRYTGEPATCGAIGFIPALGNTEGIGLMPEISWDSWYGCVDGYILRLFDFPEVEPFFEVDVGLNTSYQLTEPLAELTTFTYEIIPYNVVHGEAVDCIGLFLSTVACPPLPQPIDTFLCEGESFYWDSHIFEAPGSYEIPYRNSLDCDSTITLNLQWFEPPAQTVIDTLLMVGDEFEGVNYISDTIFTALFSSANGCDSIVTYVINIVTDVNNPDEGLFWQLYPNPAANEIFVAGKYGWKEAVLYDLHGREVRNWMGDNLAGQHRLDVSGLSSGMYLLRLRGEEAQVVLRLVLQ